MVKTKVSALLILFCFLASGTHCFSTSESVESLEEFLTVCSVQQIKLFIQGISKLIELVSGVQGDEELFHPAPHHVRQPKLQKSNEKAESVVIPVDAQKAREIIEAETKLANRFVDFALSSVVKGLRNRSDEIPLPVTTNQIRKSVLGIPFSAFANFYDGRIKGLQSIHRVGDAMFIDTGSEDSLARLALIIELNDVEIKTGFTISLMDVGPGGHVAGKLSSIKIHLKLKMSPNGLLSMDTFEVLDTGMFTIVTTGLGPLNYVFSGVGIVIGNLGKRLLLQSLEDELRGCINFALARLSTKAQQRGTVIMMKAIIAQKLAASTAIRLTTTMPTTAPTPNYDLHSFEPIEKVNGESADEETAR